MEATPWPAWIRPNHQPDAAARARMHLVAFFPDAGGDVAVSIAQDGLPVGDPLARYEVEAYDEGTWIAGWTAGPLAAFMEGIDVAAVQACTVAMMAWASVPDPKDMRVLQGGMALAKAFVRAGAIAVLDLVSLRWWSAAELAALAPDRPFRPDEHITVTVEAGRLAHTRGLAKFARPDLAIELADPASVAGLLASLATALALGLSPGDGDTARLPDGQVVRFHLRPDDSAAAAPLFFNRWMQLEVVDVPQHQDAL